MVPNGYLLLFGPEHAEEQYEALKNHKACGAETKNVKAEELQNFFLIWTREILVLSC